jgi:hypothetical protein
MMLAAPSVVQCMPDCLVRCTTIALIFSFDGPGPGEHAEAAEVLVAHPVGVALEVAELLVQLVGFDAGQRVLPGGGEDRLDGPGVEFGVAVGEPLGRVRG